MSEENKGLAALTEGLPRNHFRVPTQQEGLDLYNPNRLRSLNWNKGEQTLSLDGGSYSWDMDHWFDRMDFYRVDRDLKERIFYVLEGPPSGHFVRTGLGLALNDIAALMACEGYRMASYREFVQFLYALHLAEDLGCAFMLTALGSLTIKAVPKKYRFEWFGGSVDEYFSLDQRYSLDQTDDLDLYQVGYVAPAITHDGSGCCSFGYHDVRFPVEKTLFVKLEGKELEPSNK